MAKSPKKSVKKATRAARPTAMKSGGKPKAAKKAVKSASKSKAPKGVRSSSAGAQVAPVAAPKVTAEVTEASLAFAVEVAKLAKADKCHNVVVLDVKGLSPVTDYLVLATGTSGRQMRSTADDAVALGKESNFSPLSSSGLEGETWICVDFVDVLLHLFNEDSRSYYDLESLWGDAKRVEVDFSV